MISLLYDSISHNASNSHKNQSVTLITTTTFTLFLCGGKTTQEVPRSIYFQVERKGNGNKLIRTCLSPNGTSDRTYLPQKGSQQLKTAQEYYLPSSYVASIITNRGGLYEVNDCISAICYDRSSTW